MKLQQRRQLEKAMLLRRAEELRRKKQDLTKQLKSINTGDPGSRSAYERDSVICGLADCLVSVIVSRGF